MRVAHKVTDHQLHHKRQWRAAMTTHRVHQLPTVVVDKHIIIFPKTWANHYIHNLRPEFLLPFWKQWEDSDVMLASTKETSLIKKVNSILIQATTSFWKKELLFHFSMSLCMQASMSHKSSFVSTQWKPTFKTGTHGHKGKQMKKRSCTHAHVSIPSTWSQVRFRS
jgi:hypothetical protein